MPLEEQTSSERSVHGTEQRQRAYSAEKRRRQSRERVHESQEPGGGQQDRQADRDVSRRTRHGGQIKSLKRKQREHNGRKTQQDDSRHWLLHRQTSHDGSHDHGERSC